MCDSREFLMIYIKIPSWNEKSLAFLIVCSSLWRENCNNINE